MEVAFIISIFILWYSCM